MIQRTKAETTMVHGECDTGSETADFQGGVPGSIADLRKKPSDPAKARRLAKAAGHNPSIDALRKRFEGNARIGVMAA